MTTNEAERDILGYLKAQDDSWFEKRGRTKFEVLADGALISRLVDEHLRCVNRYGCDREWSVKDACESDPGIEI